MTEEHFQVVSVATLEQEDTNDPDLVDMASESSGLTVDFGHVEIDYHRD